MATFNKFNKFVEDLGNGVHNFSSHALKICLTNTTLTASMSVKSDFTEVSGGANGYTAGGNAATLTSWSQSSGTAKLVLADPSTWTAAVGQTIGPFRYAVLYNDTAASDQLIGYWDYASNVTLAAGETFTVDLDNVNGVLTIA